MLMLCTCRSASRSETGGRAGRIRQRRWSAFAALAVLGALLAAPGAAQADDLAVVVHPDVPVDNLSFIELRKLFLGDRQFWPSGQPVTLLLRAPPARERAVLLHTIYKMNEAQYKQYWIAKVFRTEAVSSPKAVPSSAVALQLVSAIPGAVTLVWNTNVPPDAKVLRINGLAPGDERYPLR